MASWATPIGEHSVRTHGDSECANGGAGGGGAGGYTGGGGGYTGGDGGLGIGESSENGVGGTSYIDGAFTNVVAMSGANQGFGFVKVVDGSYRIVLTPAPEPATWGLLLMGLGLSGAVLRRRVAFAKS